MSKIPVNDVFDAVETMLRDKWGYIYGTSGQLWTQSKQNTTTNEMAQKYGSRWIGHMVTDCSGVMVYIWRKHGLSIPHGSSSMVSKGYIVDCGPEPHPGWAALVDDTPDTPDNRHIGIVGRDGVTVYEAKGTQAGFVTSKVTDKKWTKFGRFRDVDYSGEVEPLPDQGKQVNYRAEVTTKSGSLNLRSGPGTKYPIVDTIPKGASVDVWMEYPDGWDFVSYMGDQGYVSAQYMTPLPPATSLPDETPVPDSDGAKTVKKTALRRWPDGAEIVLEGDWQVAYTTVGDD